MGVMSSQPVIEPMEVEVQGGGEVRCYLLVCMCIVCYVKDFGAMLVLFASVYCGDSG